MRLLSYLVGENKIAPPDVPKFERKLFFEGDRRRAYLERFVVLLFLSAIIATYGILENSDATVIGAMIIAPLMTPIMATAAALVMGQRTRAVYSVLMVVAGVILVIVVSWVLGALYTGVISFTNNPQITSRTSPNMTNLFVALASGAAGAFAMSRTDIADSLPGVAIAISLVPPLCVVGISLSAGEWSSASGAMLLFLTNFLSILLAGGGVLTLLGLGGAATRELDRIDRRKAFIAIAVGTIVVIVPLAFTTVDVARDGIAETASTQVSQTWVSQSEYDLLAVDYDDNQVTVSISGSGDVPPFSELVAGLEVALQEPTQVDLRIIPSRVLTNPVVINSN